MALKGRLKTTKKGFYNATDTFKGPELSALKSYHCFVFLIKSLSKTKIKGTSIKENERNNLFSTVSFKCLVRDKQREAE